METLTDQLSVHPVIRRFLRDDHIVNVAFTESGRRDPDKTGLLPKLLDARAAHVSHARFHTPHDLVYAVRKGTAEGHPALDAFRNEFQRTFNVILHVAVPAPFFHGLEGSHAPVYLVASSLEEDRLAGA